MTFLSWQKKSFLILFLAILSLSLMGPIASNDFIPWQPDFPIHISAIVEATKAFDEGQFPLRVSPFQYDGFRHPFFQYYSQFPYWMGALIYKLQGSTNGFLALKTVIWLGLIIAGLYIFRLVRFLTSSNPIALLTSVVYLTSPYLLININTRGDFTETIAQCWIPVVLYYSLRMYLGSTNRLLFSITAFSWFGLAITHLVTFVYTSFFMGLFFLLFSLKDLAWKRLVNLGAVYIFGCVLAAWFLIPIGLTNKYLHIADLLGNPFYYNWLTPIPTLLSITSISPLPLPGNGGMIMPLYVSVGWILLLVAGVIGYSIYKKDLRPESNYYRMSLVLLFLFMLALFCVWSPINFWQYLPQYLAIVQFPYRLLSQTTWIGCILFAFAMMALFKEFDVRYMVIGIFIIYLSSSFWLPTNKNEIHDLPPPNKVYHNIPPASLNAVPDLNFGKSAYLVKPDYIGLNSTNYIEMPTISNFNNWLILNKDIIIKNSLLYPPNSVLEIGGELFNGSSTTPITVKLMVDGKNKETKIIYPGQFHWKIEIGKFLTATEKNKEVNIQFLIDKSLFQNQIVRLELVKITKVHLLNMSKTSFIPAATIKPTCFQKNSNKICYVTVNSNANFVQLPLFYYPSLLNIKVNGKDVFYFPTPSNGSVLVGLNLEPGNYIVKSKFVGVAWANWLSVFAWFILFSLVFLHFYKKLFFLKIKFFSKLVTNSKIS